MYFLPLLPLELNKEGKSDSPDVDVDKAAKEASNSIAALILKHQTKKLKTKGYIPRITASRHLIGKDSLVISFADSISLKSDKGRKKKLNITWFKPIMVCLKMVFIFCSLVYIWKLNSPSPFI